MGVITLALVANGTIPQNDFHVPNWVVVSAGTAIALGTYAGGWRIIKTMGSRIHKMDSAQVRGAGRRRGRHPGGVERRLPALPRRTRSRAP